MLTILLQLAGGTAFLYYGADFLVKGGVPITSAETPKRVAIDTPPFTRKSAP